MSSPPATRFFSFTDPEPYGKAIRAQVEVFVAAKGDFRAELMQVDLQRLWLQRAHENLPRLFHSTLSGRRTPVIFLTAPDQRPIQHSGMNVSPGEIVVPRQASVHHHRSFAACHWGSLSLTPDDLAEAGRAIAGRELAAPPTTQVMRPPAARMTRLLALHREAGKLAEDAPDRLAHPEVARALEQQLTHAMVMCLAEGTAVEVSAGTRRHSLIVARLEHLFAANSDRPLYLGERCAATGVSERTLRACCHEHVGMGPVHYLWLRRMHLAHRALVQADPATESVTAIATDHGFWELGRFSVDYRAMFGESPSVSLRRPSGRRRMSADRPFAMPVAESA